MAELKTKPTKESVIKFLKSIQPLAKQKDAFTLLEIFQTVTGKKAVMWGPSIIGFDTYYYTSERSSQKGDWLVTGFSPRKQNLTLYILSGVEDSPLLQKLGKYKTSVGCLYINKLADVDVKVLTKLIKQSYVQKKKMYK